MEEINSVGSFDSLEEDRTESTSTDGGDSRDSTSNSRFRKKKGLDIIAAQAQCYKRLSELLEKSKRYTALLCNRIEKDNDSFALLLQAKSAQIMAQKQDINDADTEKSGPKKRGRPAKSKTNKNVDQIVPDPKKSKLDSSVQCDSPSTSLQQSVLGSQTDQLESNRDEMKILSNAEELEGVAYNQPILVTGGKLRKYQLEGVSWLMKLYLNGVNGILADEMGLGKTIQCISLVADLILIGASGPFLVCAPLSTLINWVDEFKRFAPKVPCLLYYGSKNERMELLPSVHEEVRLQESDLRSKPVVVTSYEVAMQDGKWLRKIKWDLMIVDEGHRIRNSDCKLFKELKTYNSSHRLLLTGTPLQNNLAELWTLLNFLIPEIFSDSGSFETWFDVNFLQKVDDADEQIIKEEQKSNTLSNIHQILTPFMLRRLKSDVDIVIPPKKEIVVVAPFASEQKILYKAILAKTIAQLLDTNPKEPDALPSSEVETPRQMRKSRNLNVDYKLGFEEKEEEEDGEESLDAWAEAAAKGRVEMNKSNWGMPRTSLQMRNILSLLRKCCNHPYLLKPVGERVGVDEEFVSSSGKLQVMDRMLKKLKAEGHKVLIFSQSTQLLDMVEDYCLYRGHTHCRFDGSTKLIDRQKEIERFRDGDAFLFLLSTRAGGLGINLTRADTVIIYDSDWNPQCDLQAQDRCHRFGQTNPVVVYRLVAGGSIDQKIVERATAKRKLEKLIIHKDKFKSGGSLSVSEDKQGKLVDPQDLLDIFKETDHQDIVDESVMSEEDLDKLLDRSELIKMWNEQKSGKLQNPVIDGGMESNNSHLEVGPND